MQKKTKTERKAPWEKPNPKHSGPHHHLSEAEKDEAKARAKKAGRHYPNLVDNMAVARKRRMKP